MPIERLPEEREQEAYELAVSGKLKSEIAQMIGMSSYTLVQYEKAYPEFQAKLEQAFFDATPFMESLVMRCFADKTANPNLAKNKSEALWKIMVARNPRKYGAKQQIEINQTLDIAGAIEEARRRSGIRELSDQPKVYIKDIIAKAKA